MVKQKNMHTHARTNVFKIREIKMEKKLLGSTKKNTHLTGFLVWICHCPKLVTGFPGKHPWRSCWLRGTSLPLRRVPFRKILRMTCLQSKGNYLIFFNNARKTNLLKYLFQPGLVPKGWSTETGTCSRLMKTRRNHPRVPSSVISPAQFLGLGSTPVGRQTNWAFLNSRMMEAGGGGGSERKIWTKWSKRTD